MRVGSRAGDVCASRKPLDTVATTPCFWLACGLRALGRGGVMYWRWVVLAIAAVLLLGCASQRTGFDYAGMMQRAGPPRPGQSRIVVLQEKRDGLSMAFCACDVKLDGNSVGKVIVGTYLYVDRPAGRHQLLASEVLFPGETKRDITTESAAPIFSWQGPARGITPLPA